MRLKTIDFLIIIGIMTLVTFVWQLLEIILNGYIVENKADDVIVLLLTFSLFKNLKGSGKVLK